MKQALYVGLALTAALPAVAQEQGGLRTRSPSTTLSTIEANRGCAMSNTSVTVGVNKATGNKSAAQQNLRTRSATNTGCQPLVSTQVVTGVNAGLGRGSAANQTIEATGPAGALRTTGFTRGVNTAAGNASTANQRLSNQTVGQ